MRFFATVSLAALLAASGPVSAVAQSQLGSDQPSVLTPGNGPQDNSVIAVPPAPAIVASPASPPAPPMPATPTPPGLVQSSPPSTAPDSGDTDNGDNSAPSTAQTGSNAAPRTGPDQDAIPTPPNAWQPGQFAKIGVLDKVDGEVKEVSVPVGGQSIVGDLQVNVLACVIRPPDQVPDAAVFLALQNTANMSGPPAYRGWLIRSAPGAAIAGDASEIFRIIGCT